MHGDCPLDEGVNLSPRAALQPSPAREAMSTTRPNRVRENPDHVGKGTLTLFPSPASVVNPVGQQMPPGNPSTSTSRAQSPSPQPSRARSGLKRGRCSPSRSASSALSISSTSSVESLPSLGGNSHKPERDNKAKQSKTDAPPVSKKHHNKSGKLPQRSPKSNINCLDRSASMASSGANNSAGAARPATSCCCRKQKLPWPPGYEELAFLIICKPQLIPHAFNNSYFTMPPHLLWLPDDFRLKTSNSQQR